MGYRSNLSIIDAEKCWKASLEMLLIQAKYSSQRPLDGGYIFDAQPFPNAPKPLDAYVDVSCV